MPDKDTITKEYMRCPDIFADAFNFLLYDGRPVIRPENLQELDATAIALPYGQEDADLPVQKQRDVLKVAMRDEKAAYLILGVENQSDVHFAMPVRNMLYDALQYSGQVTAASKSHRKSGARSTKEEFLSGFHRQDKLIPVITLVMYFGANEWTAPRSIHEMLDVQDESILTFTPDYKINLIAPQEIADADMQKFRTDLQLALQYIKYQKDRQQLQALLQENAAYSHVPIRTARVIRTMTGTNININEKKESVDMCEAIQQMMNDSRAEGMTVKSIEIAKNMLENALPYELVAKCSGLPLDEVKRIAGELSA